MATLTRLNADFMASVTSSVQRQQQFPVPFPGLSSEENRHLCFSLSHGFIIRHGFIIKIMTNVTIFEKAFWATVFDFLVMSSNKTVLQSKM